jgi:hypothetical protein
VGQESRGKEYKKQDKKKRSWFADTGRGIKDTALSRGWSMGESGIIKKSWRKVD